METEFAGLEKRIDGLIQRVRDLEKGHDRLQSRIDELERLREAAANKVIQILDRLEEPE